MKSFSWHTTDPADKTDDYTYLHILIYTYIYVHRPTYTCIHLHILTHTYIYVHLLTYIYVRLRTYTYIDVYWLTITCVYLQIRTYTCIHVHALTYTYIYVHMHSVSCINSHKLTPVLRHCMSLDPRSSCFSSMLWPRFGLTDIKKRVCQEGLRPLLNLLFLSCSCNTFPRNTNNK